MNQTTFSGAGHTDHWESHSCVSPSVMNTPAFSPGNQGIAIHLAGLSRLFSCKPAPRAAETLSPPPTQKEGGRAPASWTLLVTQRAVFCAQYWYYPFCCYCLFCNWNQEGSRCVKGVALQLRAAWFCLSVSRTRKKWSYHFASLPIPRPIFLHVPFLPLPSHSIHEAKECIHHLTPTFFLYSAGSLNLPNSLHVPLLQPPSPDQIQFHSLVFPPSVPVLYLPNSSLTASSLLLSNTQL